MTTLLLLLLLVTPAWGDILPPINPSRPVNAQHPLAKGLAHWWRATPFYSAGQTWRSLVSESPGAMTSMTTAGTTGFQPSWPQGSEGEIRGNGTSSWVNAPTGTMVADLTAFTVVARYRSTGTVRGILYQEKNTSTSAALILDINEAATNAADAMGQVIDDAGGTSAVAISGNIGSNDGRPHYLGIVQTSKSARALYFDGIVVDTNATTVGTVTVQSRALMSRPSGLNYWFNGAVMEILVWTRALSDAEMQQVVLSGRLGHPGLLNRMTFQTRVLDMFVSGRKGSLFPFFTAPPQ